MRCAALHCGRRGLILDTELGNLVKADRFGFIKRAMHGTKMLSPSEVRAAYGERLCCWGPAAVTSCAACTVLRSHRLGKVCCHCRC